MGPADEVVLPQEKIGISVWRRAASRLKSAWLAIRPDKNARQGAIFAAVLTILWTAVIGAFNLESGFGLPADFAFAFAVALLGVPLAALLIALVLFLLKFLPKLLTGFFVACVLLLSLLFWGPTGYIFGAVVVFVEAALGATLATILLGGLRQSSAAKKVVTYLILLLSLAANVGLYSLLHSDGVDAALVQVKQNETNLPPPLTLPNPSDKGPFAVQTLTYGSGDSLRRGPDFGPSVAIRTPTVDASKFFKDFNGWKAWIRKRYWGFGMDKLPLNGRVWYPIGPGPFPLMLIVHGNHQMSVPSDHGYAYLGELLASRGFIMVSVDENFLNSGLFHDPPKQQAVRGWLLLEHLKLWHEWNQQAGNVFHGKLDVNNIALAGHSRGGEAAATAALFNRLAFYPDDATIPFHYGYKIKSVLAISPAEGQYKPAEQNRILRDVNYFTIHGANDSDVSSFAGSRQWDHVRFTGDVPAFKSELYIYRANHGQFNTVWGRTDAPAPMNWFLNLRPLLQPEQQRQIAKVYFSAYLEATLHNRKEYVDLFRDYRRGRAWLPDTLYVNRYADQLQQTVCSFSEDADVTTTTLPGGRITTRNLTLWREGKMPTKGGTRDDNAVFLGWNWKGDKQPSSGKEPAYEVEFPASATPLDRLLLSIAVSSENAPRPGNEKEQDEKKKDQKNDPISDPTDFSIEAMTTDGAKVRLPLSRFTTLLPPLRTRLTKIERLDTSVYEKPSEPVFQSVSIPLTEFTAKDARLQPEKINRIQLVFDKTPARVIIVSSIGFERIQ